MHAAGGEARQEQPGGDSAIAAATAAAVVDVTDSGIASPDAPAAPPQQGAPARGAGDVDALVPSGARDGDGIADVAATAAGVNSHCVVPGASR